MRNAVRILALPLLLALLCSLPAGAKSTPEAAEWLTKLTKAYEQPYRVRYLAEMDVDQAGQAIGVQMEGVTTQSDRDHMRMEMRVVMSMGEMKMSVAMLGVLDGETLWLESDNPMAGGIQVAKIPAEQAAELTGGPSLGGGASGLDPVGQIVRMAGIFDFDVTGAAGGEVTLVAPLTKEAMSKLSASLPPDATGDETCTLVLDEKTAFPRSMRIGSGKPFMVMSFDPVQFVDADKLNPELFQYTPPEDARLIDMGAVISVDE